jgi:hypothetical protein
MDIKRRSLKKKLPKLAKPTVESVMSKLPTNKPAEPLEQSNVPRITNESIAEHREEVLSSARKYIYPLRHSRHRVVKISIGLFALAVVAFFVGCVVFLYKFQNT